MRVRLFAPLGVLTLLAAAGLLAAAPPAGAAGETVNVWLTTTDDAAGRHVVRGLQQQTPLTFGTGTGGAGQNLTVDENTRFQQFVGAGASFTDTAAWLMNSSGALTASTRDSVMQKLFSPTAGIGLDFLRNPMGASDLARFSYSYDDLPAGQTDPGMARFSIAHDLADVVPLTRQARTLNPGLTVMGSPWSAPGWMKDSGTMNGGWLQAQYYGAYAQYFVKYIQAYQAQGIPIDFVSVQNEPTCCAGYPSMSWNGSGLDFFMKTNLFPAFHAAGISTKVLALDWNWDAYPDFGSVPVGDATVRNDPNFGGMAWHGYGGNVATQSTIHDQFPSLSAYDTEHSGGTWIANQQQEDMHNIVDYTRNWGRTVTKWSLAVDQNMGPHNGGCGTCTGLVTVHNGDSRSGQVDFTVEYYDMGHLTKFVRPGASRIASTASAAVPNVAWRNPDGSKALIAYNDTATAQTVRVNWGGSSFAYTLPTKTTATFTWAGTQVGGGAPVGPITGLAGKCVDVAAAGTANGTPIQLFGCNGSTAQRWTVAANGSLQALGKCLDVTSAGTADGTPVQLWDCNGTGAQQWTYTAGHDLVNPNANKCLDVTGNTSADGTHLQIWTCTGGANQKWTVPTGGTTPPPTGVAGMQVAPYYYNGFGSPPNIATVMSATGVRWFTMAFVLSNGTCNPQWDGFRPLTGGVDLGTIGTVRAGGGDVVPSFGGASGTKLEISCTSAAALAGAYQQVINAYGLRAIDIDIEGDAYNNATVQQRTVDALKTVRASNPGVTIYVTFPANQTGPDATLINRAAASGLTVDAWTIMPFDFGGNGQDMGALSTQSAEGLKNRLVAAYGYTADQAYRHSGISSMNGITDVGENVSVANFRTMLSYAQAHHLARLTFWSVNRDRPCAGALADNCSGVAQANWDYTRVFAAYRG